MNQSLKTNLFWGRVGLQLLCYAAFLLSAFALSLPTYFLNLFFFCWMALNLLDLLTRGKYSFELPNKQNIHLYFLMASYLWMLVSVLWTTNFNVASSLLTRRISYLIFPLFALWGVNRFFRFKHILLIFIGGAIFSSIVIIIFGWLKYHENPDMFINMGRFFSDVVFMGYKHRTYFSLSLIFSLLFYVYLKPELTKRISTMFYYGIFLFLYVLYFLLIYFSQSRMSLIIFLVISCSFVASFLWKRNLKKWIIIGLAIVIGGSVLLIKNHPRMQNFALDKEKMTAFDPRYNLWRNAKECIEKSNFLLGTGIGDAFGVFDKNHQKPEYQDNYCPVDHPHNDFMRTQLETGFIGNLLLLCIIVSAFLNNRKGRSRTLALNILLIWLLFMLIEDIGITSYTVYMFAFSMLLIYWNKQNNEPIETFADCFRSVKKAFKR